MALVMAATEFLCGAIRIEVHFTRPDGDDDGDVEAELPPLP
jgi:hypothetical protein